MRTLVCTSTRDSPAWHIKRVSSNSYTERCWLQSLSCMAMSLALPMTYSVSVYVKRAPCMDLQMIKQANLKTCMIEDIRPDKHNEAHDVTRTTKAKLTQGALAVGVTERTTSAYLRRPMRLQQSIACVSTVCDQNGSQKTSRIQRPRLVLFLFSITLECSSHRSECHARARMCA